MRDQLDRFGEIDATAKLLQTIAEHTTDGVVLNREDPRVRAIAEHTGGKTVRYFGLSDSLRHHFPSDDDLHTQSPSAQTLPDADVTLLDFTPTTGTFKLSHNTITTNLAVRGAYNIFNAAAALATVELVCGTGIEEEKLVESLSHVQPAFGRGESMIVGGQPLELVLVKNPSGFRLGLSSFPATNWATMIAINDNYADGRDMSWLWDVSFETLVEHGVHTVSGARSYDMALRLAHDIVDVSMVTPDLKAALRSFIQQNSNTPKRIYCTYTAMLALRRELRTITSIQEIDA